jgi:hypothetical protein
MDIKSHQHIRSDKTNAVPRFHDGRVVAGYFLPPDLKIRPGRPAIAWKVPRGRRRIKDDKLPLCRALCWCSPLEL